MAPSGAWGAAVWLQSTVEAMAPMMAGGIAINMQPTAANQEIAIFRKRDECELRAFSRIQDA